MPYFVIRDDNLCRIHECSKDVGGVAFSTARYSARWKAAVSNVSPVLEDFTNLVYVRVSLGPSEDFMNALDENLQARLS